MDSSFSSSAGSPLMPVSARVSTGRDRFPTAASSAAGVRPYGLRFAADPGPTARTARIPAWTLDPATQIARATADHTPLYRMPNTGTRATTGASPDGGGSTGGEEWTADFYGDEG